MMKIMNTVFIILLLAAAFSQAKRTRNNNIKFNLQRSLGMKIIGGTPANIEEFPYQVAISYKNQFYCGGAILTKVTVATAAHCIKPYESKLDGLLIRAGSSNYGKDGVTSKVCSAFVHENFTTATLENDIALLILCQSLPHRPGIGGIDLPPPNQVLMTGDETILTGWGRTESGGRVSPVLQKVIVPIVPFTDCVSAYTEKKKITRNMFCAGSPEGGKDGCQGDSGGPLAMKGKLVGIVSFGWGCGDAKFPGVYVRVSNYRNWIKRQIGI